MTEHNLGQFQTVDNNSFQLQHENCSPLMTESHHPPRLALFQFPILTDPGGAARTAGWFWRRRWLEDNMQCNTRVAQPLVTVRPQRRHWWRWRWRQHEPVVVKGSAPIGNGASEYRHWWRWCCSITNSTSCCSATIYDGASAAPPLTTVAPLTTSVPVIVKVSAATDNSAPGFTAATILEYGMCVYSLTCYCINKSDIILTSISSYLYTGYKLWPTDGSPHLKYFVSDPTATLQ